MTNAEKTSKMRRLGALSRADQWLLVRAGFWLGVARLRLILIPFNRLANRLSTASSIDHNEPDPDILRRVGFALRAAAANVPWRSDCFPQTIAARSLLNSYGYASTIHFGVDRVEAADLLGHAWLTCGGTVVTGGEELSRYTEIHQFSNG